MSRVDMVREKIADALYRQRCCINKANAFDAAGDRLRAELFDEWAAAAEKEADELYRELHDAEHEGAMASRRDTLRNQGWARQG